MPKLKTNRAAAKRIRKTAKGYKAYSAGRRHKPRSQGPASASAICVQVAAASLIRPMPAVCRHCFRIINQRDNCRGAAGERRRLRRIPWHESNVV